MGCESRAKRRPDRITERHGEAVKEGEVVAGEREKSRVEDELGKEGMWASFVDNVGGVEGEDLVLRGAG
jgi:hypothetical protein